MAYCNSRKETLRMVAGGMTSSLILLLSSLLLWGWDVIYYQWVGYLAQFPFTRSFQEALSYACVQWAVPLGFCLLFLGASQKLRPRLMPQTILMLLSGSATLSLISILAYRKNQGDINSIGLVTCLLCVAAVLSFAEWIVEHSARKKLWPILLVLMIAWEGAIFFKYRAYFAQIPSFLNNGTSEAYKIALRHPNQVYVPYHPMATFLADRKIYHFGAEINDRYDTRQFFDLYHFVRHLPEKLKFVVMPPDASVYMMPWNPLFRFLPAYTAVVDDPKYPGWLIMIEKTK